MEVPWTERRAASHRLLLIAVATAAMALVSMAVIDAPIARAVAPYEPSPLWTYGIDVLEWVILLPLWRFALAAALVAGMLVTVVVPGYRPRAPAWMFVTGVYLASWLMTGVIKDLTGRLRPLQWLMKNHDETFAWVGGISFPSGHVTMFASLVVPIVVLYPRLWPLLGIVVFAALARIGVDAHFVSDTLGAITLVVLVTWIVGRLVRPCRR